MTAGAPGRARGTRADGAGADDGAGAAGGTGAAGGAGADTGAGPAGGTGPDRGAGPAGGTGPDRGVGPAGGTGPDRGGGRQALGAEGEARAARWYEDQGFEVLEQNWRRREGEIDLIVRQGTTVVFCEVKTRSSDRFGTGAESVLAAKQRRIRRLAARWLSELTPASGRARVDVRFDVVSITAGQVEVIEDAF